jgi:hypothetical protein
MFKRVDWPRRLSRFADNRFEAGEELVSIAVFQVRDADGARGDGMAGRLPLESLLFALTNSRRVLVYSFGPGSSDLTYATAYRTKDIVAIDLGRGVFARKATIRFTDGSSASRDAPRAQGDLCRRLSKR